MDNTNNFQTLKHYKGSVWVTNHDINSELPKGLNICHYFNGKFMVLQYIIATEQGYTTTYNKFYNDLKDIVENCLKAIGTLALLESEVDETIITCSVCGNTFDELDVNIVDYELDLCVNCEKHHLESTTVYLP